MRHKILCDFSSAYKAQFNFSGIPQETRILLGSFAQSSKIDVDALLMGSEKFDFNFKGAAHLETSLFLGPYSGGDFDGAQKTLLRFIIKMISRKLYTFIFSSFFLKKSCAYLNHIDRDFFEDLMRRTIFPNGFHQFSKEEFLKDVHYYWIKFSKKHRAISIIKNKLLKLNTGLYDYFIVQGAGDSFHPSKNTQLIVRYHDGIPLRGSDSMTSDVATQVHFKGCQLSVKHDAFFVCNSTASLDDLLNIVPAAEKKAKVIPCFVPKIEKKVPSFQTFKDLCRRYSFKKISTSHWTVQKTIPSFILCVSTIEARKNFLSLIDAWLKIKEKIDQGLKLVIIGKVGWKSKGILRKMKPFIEQGSLIHLENVSQADLPYFYSAATCFVSPSFSEGFGLPPCEAMQCGCPVAVSDISGHRYSVGGAGLYFDPYDTDNMVHTISLLLGQEKNNLLIQDLIEKGYKNVERYSKEAVLPQWEQLFDDLKKGRKNS